ncbi:MAG: type II secretion system GspH family protein [Lachnospiraceae bacterium]|nr:type II secretion system GspH family protein [Lachnospiraceae bacterium]
MKKIMKDQKGFTLVELIVVLVILAILAAILVPALLGYIDKARNGQYLEEAHSIYTAIQVVEDEQYAKNDLPAKTASFNATTAAAVKEVNDMVSPTELQSATITFLGSGTSVHADYTVSTLKLEFKSQNGKTVKIDMDSKGNWGDPTVTAS